MTTAELYRKHKKGEVGRDKFIYEVRRDSNLPWITNITSYDDAVRILKNKGIISEALATEGSYTDPDSEKFSMHLVDTLEGGNWDLTPEQLDQAVEYAEQHYYDLQGDFANNHSVDGGTYAAAKYIVNLVKQGGIKEETEPARQPSNKQTITTAELLKIAKKAGQIVIDAERDLVQLGVAYGDKISMDAVNAILANYDMSLEDLEDIEDDNDGEDKWMSMGDLYDRGYLQEQEKPTTDQILDNLNPYTVKAALNYELSKKPVNGDVEYGKLLDKIAKKLQKNPKAYEFTQFANATKIEKADAKLQMEPVKEKTDKHNGMKPIKGHKDAKANTKTSKKENKKGLPKGVKVMKEAVLADLTNFLKKKVKLAEEFGRHEYSSGMEVHTPNGPGMVKEVGGGTVSVQYEDGSIRDFQMNYLNHIRENGMSLDHYEHELESFDWEKKDQKQVEALQHTYSQLSEEDKKKAFEMYCKATDNSKVDEGYEFDGYNVTKPAKEEETKTERKHQLISALKELLFKKKTQTGTVVSPTAATDNKPISLNPSNVSDKAIMQDPEFRKKYQSA